MKRTFCSLLLGLSCFSAHANVQVSDCVIREPAPGSDKTGLYFNLTYTLDEQTQALRLPGPESLFGAAVPELTTYTELHDMTHVDGVMKMQRLSRLPVKPNQPVVLKPGGKHVMLFNLAKRPVAGEEYDVDVWMAWAPGVTCKAIVKTSAQLAQEVKK
ncbi:copper chaperone PCu(A)C [Vibrio sp. SM6]|uniref:Copper chaperone PCu(A)C n=1 Tax=Vibrio agarilyticus TaxID=2726741 RepID=A0A7X8TNC2_9VIBR|nr:copper chaperone PCu(A)C [Vibrio agarilyticus]NLS11913.1 copper chaperone PCu(A)C [Vibrio agarilyticus]